MAGSAEHRRADAALALVADDDAHAGRLADEAGLRLHLRTREPLHEAAHADAAHLLVIREGEVNRLLEPSLGHARGGRETHGEEAFHVARTAPVQAPAFLPERERVG